MQELPVPRHLADPWLLQQLQGRTKLGAPASHTTDDRDLDRYSELITQEQQRLALSVWQRRLIWLACSGKVFAADEAERLGAWMREAIRLNGAADQADVDLDEALRFADEVETWPLLRILAAIDAVEREGLPVEEED